MTGETEQYKNVCKGEFQSRLDRLERFQHFIWFICGAAISAGIGLVFKLLGAL